MSAEKIIKIVVTELIEALVFGFILLISAQFDTSLASLGAKTNCSSTVLLIWALSGLATPFIIWADIEGEILSALKQTRLPRR